MPWTRETWKKHTPKNTPAKAAEAGRQAANAAIRSGRGEVAAIRIGKAVAKRVAQKRR